MGVPRPTGEVNRNRGFETLNKGQNVHPALAPFLRAQDQSVITWAASRSHHRALNIDWQPDHITAAVASVFVRVGFLSGFDITIEQASAEEHGGGLTVLTHDLVLCQIILAVLIGPKRRTTNFSFHAVDANHTQGMVGNGQCYDPAQQLSSSLVPPIQGAKPGRNVNVRQGDSWAVSTRKPHVSRIESN